MQTITDELIKELIYVISRILRICVIENGLFLPSIRCWLYWIICFISLSLFLVLAFRKIFQVIFVFAFCLTNSSVLNVSIFEKLC